MSAAAVDYSSAKPPRCPACGGARLANIGRVFHPLPTRVAGVPIDLSDLDLALWRCGDCAFAFKWPPIPEHKLLACYEAAASDHWGAEVDAKERNFDRIALAIGRHARGRRILDIGCFNGAFLGYLGAGWETFGVEPSRSAAQVAGSRGVQVLADTIDHVPANQAFDVITAMDVVEHISEPAPFFRTAARLLRAGGILVVTTGNTAHWTWRLQQSRYWYCSYLPEHVSFYQWRTMERLASLSGMRSVEQVAISHKRAPVSERLSQAVKGVAFAFGVRTGWLGLPPLRRKFARRAGTNWIAARDHMIHVMRLNDERGPEQAKGR